MDEKYRDIILRQIEVLEKANEKTLASLDKSYVEEINIAENARTIKDLVNFLLYPSSL